MRFDRPMLLDAAMGTALLGRGLAGRAPEWNLKRADIVSAIHKSHVAAGEGHSQYYYVMRQGLWTAIGLFAMLAGMRFDYGRLRRPAIAYGLLALSVVLLAGVFAFSPINGARRWIRFAGF